FKNEGNPFGIELKIIIKFEKFRYKISYYFSKIDELKYKDSEYFIVINKLKVNNYYHQHLSKTEIDDCANLIGHDLLVHIKKIEKNKNYFDNNISEKQVMALKKGFTKKHEKYIKFNENSLAFNPKNNTFITDSEISYIEKEDFLKYVNSKINLKSNIGFLYDNEYFLPF
ncbi:MAG: hypothetical protein U9Q83_08075, partial [Bacteroidota bacterium]|nr:hypothetical protein [Bacteroidota bacterium]